MLSAGVYDSTLTQDILRIDFGWGGSHVTDWQIDRDAYGKTDAELRTPHHPTYNFYGNWWREWSVLSSSLLSLTISARVTPFK